MQHSVGLGRDSVSLPEHPAKSRRWKSNSNKCGEESSCLELELHSGGAALPYRSTPLDFRSYYFPLLLRTFSIFTTFNLTAFAEDFSDEREDLYMYHIKDLSDLKFRL